MNDTPVACQTREPTDPQGDRWHGEAVADEASPRSGVSAHYLSPTGIVSRPGASAFFVSAGDSFAPRRELLLSAVTKVAKSTGRNYVSALPQRAMADSDFPHLLAGITFHHRCQSKGLRVRSPARRLTRPLASATVDVFRSYRRSGRGYFAPRARERVSDGDNFALRRELLLSAVTKVAKSTA